PPEWRSAFFHVYGIGPHIPAPQRPLHNIPAVDIRRVTQVWTAIGAHGGLSRLRSNASRMVGYLQRVMLSRLYERSFCGERSTRLEWVCRDRCPTVKRNMRRCRSGCVGKEGEEGDVLLISCY